MNVKDFEQKLLLVILSYCLGLLVDFITVNVRG